MWKKLPVTATILSAVLFAVAPTQAGDSGVQVLDPNAYQSFVGNWTPTTEPLCAAIRSADDWKRVLHPAGTMGKHAPFAPPSDFWKDRAVLLFARAIPAGDTSHVFTLVGTERTKDMIEVNLKFAPPPAASSTMKWYFAVAIPKPVPALVRFRQEGDIVCTLDLAAGHWESVQPGP